MTIFIPKLKSQVYKADSDKLAILKILLPGMLFVAQSVESLVTRSIHPTSQKFFANPWSTVTVNVKFCGTVTIIGDQGNQAL